MQPGERLDGRDDGRGINPGRAESRLGCLRLRCELRCRFGLVLRLVLRGMGRVLRAWAAAGVPVTRCVLTSGRLDTSKVPNSLVKVTEPYAPPGCCCCTPPPPCCCCCMPPPPCCCCCTPPIWCSPVSKTFVTPLIWIASRRVLGKIA